MLIAGPTASGKSALALALAERLGGVVINADSMQVYRELKVLTARPGPDEEARAPHRLYGAVGAAEAFSVGHWLRLAAAAIAEARETGRTPIVVGGTGLYFAALTEGLAEVPEVPARVRAAWRGVLEHEGPVALRQALAARDPAAAAALAGDPQRVLRALEVIEHTGRSLLDWQRRGAGEPVIPAAAAAALVLAPPRAWLAARILARAQAMVGAGAVAEVRALFGLGLPAHAPAMKAIGVPQIGAHLAGEITLETAVVRTAAASRRYAKRQETWFRGRMADWHRLAAEDEGLAAAAAAIAVRG